MFLKSIQELYLSDFNTSFVYDLNYSMSSLNIIEKFLEMQLSETTYNNANFTIG